MQSACRRRVLLMNMSVPEACDEDSREKWDVTLSNKCFFVKTKDRSATPAG